MRRLLAAFALSIALAVCLAPAVAFAADDGNLTVGATTLTTQMNQFDYPVPTNVTAKYDANMEEFYVTWDGELPDLPEATLYEYSPDRGYRLFWSTDGEDWEYEDTYYTHEYTDGVVPGKTYYIKVCTWTSTISRLSSSLSRGYVEGKDSEVIKVVAKASLAGAEIVLANDNVEYTGEIVEPSVLWVTLNGKFLELGTDYTVSAKSGKNVGSYKVTVTGKGSYDGTASATFKVIKATNKLSKTKVTKTLKAKSLKKKAATIALPTAKFGKATWKVSHKDSKKVLTLTKAGEVKVKKGAKADAYTIKLKANVKGTSNYMALKNKVVTVTVKVK